MKIKLIFLGLIFVRSVCFSDQLSSEGPIIIDGQHYTVDVAAEKVIPMLKSGDVEQQKKSLTVVVRGGKNWIASDAVLSAVEDLINSSDENISSAAAEALLHVNSIHSQETFKKMCGSDKSFLRLFGARGLQQMGGLSRSDLNLVVDVYLSMLNEPVSTTDEMAANIRGAVIMGLEQLAKEANLPMIGLQNYMKDRVSDNKQDNKKQFEEYLLVTANWWQVNRDEVISKLSVEDQQR